MTGSRRALRSIIVMGVALAAGCSYLLISQKHDTLVFSHKRHVDNGVGCEACHQNISEPATAAESHLPTMDTCAACHPEEVKSRCAMCHTRPEKPAAVQRTRTNLHFSHKDHLGRVKGDCLACHKAAAKATSAAMRLVPTMDPCLSCHQKDFSALKCGNCHISLAEFELEPIIHFSHQGNFLKEHKEFARTDVSLCAQCHEQSFCSDCHSSVERLASPIKYPERLDREFIHRGDWITIHRFEAGADSNQCLKCHDSRRCAECHQKEGISMAAPGAPDPHPSGWLMKGSGQFHGDAARRDAAACASCHDQGAATICIACHKTGGPNPHPTGWKSTLGKTTDPVCKYCHQ